jgi:hypothetical protein
MMSHAGVDAAESCLEMTLLGQLGCGMVMSHASDDATESCLEMMLPR